MLNYLGKGRNLLWCNSRVATVREKSGKNKFFKVREKSGKILDIIKVSERSGNYVFWFIVHKFSSSLWNAFSFRKDEKYAVGQAKAINSTLYAWPIVVVVVSGFSCECFLSIPSPSFREKRKETENEEKNIGGLQKKAKVNVNIDCFSLIKGQWKLFKGQGKVKEKSGNF